jgi:3-dehydroquinate synthetase
MVKKKEALPNKTWEKIKKLYNNYGMDTENMEEDEISRLIDYYENNKNNLEKDISKSLTNKETFSEDELI